MKTNPILYTGGFFYLKNISYISIMVSDKIKNIIFNQLYKELLKVEIISYKDSIYFINRENEYWYFEYEKCGKLWWRYDFFTNFFLIFSLESNDYEKIMGEWVEEVLNCKVSTTGKDGMDCSRLVEEVLNCKVSTTYMSIQINRKLVKEALNCKVTSTNFGGELIYPLVGEVLNCKVNTTIVTDGIFCMDVDEVLDRWNPIFVKWFQDKFPDKPAEIYDLGKTQIDTCES